MDKILLYEELRKIGGADRVVEMQKFYNKNGHYRAEDLNRLLGNPMKGVSHSLIAFGSKTQVEIDRRDVEAMELWIETGCVHEEYLNEVLGDISIGINAFSDKYIIP